MRKAGEKLLRRGMRKASEKLSVFVASLLGLFSIGGNALLVIVFGLLCTDTDGALDRLHPTLNPSSPGMCT